MAEKSQKEAMIERLIYFAIMTLLASWGNRATDVAIVQTEKVESKREQIDQEREMFRQYILEVMAEQEECQ